MRAPSTLAIKANKFSFSGCMYANNRSFFTLSLCVCVYTVRFYLLSHFTYDIVVGVFVVVDIDIVCQLYTNTIDGVALSNIESFWKNEKLANICVYPTNHDVTVGAVRGLVSEFCLSLFTHTHTHTNIRKSSQTMLLFLLCCLLFFFWSFTGSCAYHSELMNN